MSPQRRTALVSVIAACVLIALKLGTAIATNSLGLLSEAARVVEDEGVTVTTFARQGDPADAILDVAEERKADLIMVGNKGMTGAKRFLLGSVPNKVSHHAPCSVLIVRTT